MYAPSALGRRIASAFAVVLVVLHVAKALFFAAAGPAPLYRDALNYWQLATEIRAGDWLLLDSAGATRTPVYPWFLAVHGMLFGDAGVSAAAVTQQLATAATAFLAAWICFRATGSRAGALLALLLSLFSVSRSLIAHYLWSDNLLSLLLTGTLAVYVEWWRVARTDPGCGRARALALLVGIGLGVCALTRPVAQYLVIPIAVSALYHLRRAPSERWRHVRVHGFALLLGFGLTLTPWLVRNQLLFDETFLVRFTGRTTWLSCFHPRAANLPFVETPAMKHVLAIAGGSEAERRELWYVYAKLTGAGHSEVEADAMMAAATAETMRALPIQFGVATVEQFFGFWTYPYPVPRWRENDPLIELEGTYLDQRPLRVDSLLPYYQSLLDRVGGPRYWVFATAALTTLGAIGLLLVRPAQRSLGVALASILLYFSTVTAIASYPLYRFRSILEPTMIASVCIAVGSRTARGRSEQTAR